MVVGYEAFMYQKSIPFRDSGMYVIGKSSIDGAILVGKFGDYIPYEPSSPADTTTSVDDLFSSSVISIQPNPIQNTGVVYGAGMKDASANLTIYNVKGQLVHNALVRCQEGAFTYVIPEIGMDKGGYLLLVSDSHQVKSSKLVKW